MIAIKYVIAKAGETRGSRTALYFLGQRWGKNFWSPLIDNPFNDGFLDKNFNIFFQLN